VTDENLYSLCNGSGGGQVSDICISPGSVATRLQCGGIFDN